MSTTATRLPLDEAREIAEQLVALLQPACQRIVISGSIRREKADIGDVDLLCMPRLTPLIDLFGESSGASTDHLHDRLCDLERLGTIDKRHNALGRTAWGAQLKWAAYHGLNVDIRACVDPSIWGAWLLISTGPADFNKAIVTPVWQGGKLPSGFEWKDGFRLFRYGGRVETPTEADVFAALGYAYQEPPERGIAPLIPAPAARANEARS
jgi:DNA polymerase/3'-5' exonuclease PolX